jgi:hypothetical protein
MIAIHVAIHVLQDHVAVSQDHVVQSLTVHLAVLSQDLLTIMLATKL